MKKLLLCGLLLTSVADAAQIIRIQNTPVNRKIMEELGIDYVSRQRKTIDILFDERLENVLKTRNFLRTRLMDESKVVNEDVNAQFEQVRHNSRGPGGELGIYHSFAEVEKELKDLVSKYPDLCNLTVAGTTFEKRPIYALEISNKKSTVAKADFLVMGTHHAREWIASEVPMALINDLLSKKDPETIKLLDTSRIVVVPMLNPDGAEHSHFKDSMWRKNRKVNTGNTIGVDPNRNYSYKWGVSGASSSGWSDTFKGPKPLSEEENQTIQHLAEKYKFVSSVSFHSYSELILWPWSYTGDIHAKDEAVLALHGKKMAEIMKYEPMQSSDLYPAAGDSDDFLYANYGVMAYTIELASQFVPNEAQVPAICADGVKALRYLFLNARTPLSAQAKPANYAAKILLEDLVRDSSEQEGHYASEIRTELLQKLGTIDSTLIESAMNDMDMNPLMRENLKKELQQSSAFQKLE